MAVSDDGKNQWNPTGGPNGTGAWEPITNPGATQLGFQQQSGVAPTPIAQPRPPIVQQVAGAWGHTGDSIDPATGKPIPGTNGMAADRDRYRGMGDNPEHPTGPQIDRTVSNESRDLSMGSLGMLRDRAMGGSTPAQEQARAQTAGAVNGLQSGAATIQGGASARAGASRMAQRIGANVQAQGDQDREALRAREMADAAGQYFGGAQSQRSRDLGQATSQAGLDVGQRAANDQREGFYEGMAQDTQNANLNHQLGRNEADVAATAASNNNNAARDAASREASKNFTNGILGAGQGVAKGFEYGAGAPKQEQSSDPWDPKNYSGSDERMKVVYGPPRKPMGDKEASRLKKQAEGYRDTSRASNEAQLAEGPSVRRIADGTAENGYQTTLTDGAEKAFGDNRQRYYGNDSGSDYDLRGAFAAGETRGTNGHMTDRFKKPNHETFSDESQYDKGDGKAGHWVGEKFTPGKYQGVEDKDVEAIRYGVKRPAPPNVYGDIRDVDPAVARERALAQAREDVANDNRGVGGAPRGYALSRAGKAGDMFYGGPRKTEHEDPDMAPGTHDFRKHGAPVDRDVMTSDANAKRAAFLDGVNHTQAMHDSGTVPPPPKYMTDAVTKEKTAAEHNVQRVKEKAPKVARAVGRGLMKASEWSVPGQVEAAAAPENLDVAGFAENAAAAKERAARALGGGMQARPTYAPTPGVKRLDTTSAPGMEKSIPSDKHTKYGVHAESPMADANRSMAPSVYAYKPGFAEDEGQHEGEKNVGPMAQNMERDPIAGTAIVKRPDGLLAIDKDKGLKLVMGGLADLQGQLDSMQRKKERRA